MDSLDEGKRATKGFFKYVFNYDEESRGEIMNIVQFIMMALIPIISLNKFIQNYIPQPNDEKGSLEISAEIIIQILIMYLGLVFVKRIIYYFPTYSGVPYPHMSVIFEVLSSLTALVSMQTKVGEKINILFERLLDLLNGNSKDDKKKKGKKTNVRVSQPISQPIGMPTMPSYNDGTSISSLPVDSSPPPPQYQQQAAQMQSPEPVAASELLGGYGSFSSW